MDNLPEILFSEASATTRSRQILRLAESGRLRKIYAGVYTSNLEETLETIVRRNWHSIAGHLLPDAVLASRSGFDVAPHDGHLYLTRGRTRRTLDLPGLIIDVIPGPAAVQEGPAADQKFGGLFLPSEARTFLENLARGKGVAERVLPQPEVERKLDQMLLLRGDSRLNQLRDQAREISKPLGKAREFERLDTLVGALLGTRAAKGLWSEQALARAAGRPYDPQCLQRFDVLFADLRRPFPFRPDPALTDQGRENFAFLEAYFSNYIEGTTFLIAEAEAIVFQGAIISGRSADSHDILGTYQAAMREPLRSQLPENDDAFLGWLKTLNRTVMERRAERLPGEWKDRANQAGSTVFVAPELVVGTLRQGFQRISALEDPFARALMTMFVITEIHPFLDGNGRTARLAMNAYLTAAGACRIIIPTIYREDYLLPLKALSHNTEPEPFLRSMDRAQAWSAAFDYRDLPTVLATMSRCNAFQEDLRQYRLLFP